MVTELGYCNLCEKQKMISQDHHCTICYELYCEDCYYETIYENELCQKCTDDYKNTEYIDTEDTDTENTENEYTEDTDTENTENEYTQDTEDTENEDMSLKKKFDRLRETVKSLQLQNEKFKQKHCLLIALETIDLRNDITRQNIIDIKYTIKELLYNNSSDVTDNDGDLYIRIIEELSGLKLNSSTELYTVKLSVHCQE